MEKNESGYNEDCKMKKTDVFIDAGKLNEATYSSNEGPEGQQLPEDSSQLDPTNDASRLPAPTHLDSNLFYDMSGDKFLIIFNHYKYEKWRQKNFVQPSLRPGTYEDVISLERTFRNLGFVINTYDDCTYDEIEKHLKNMCKKDHSNTSCVAVAVTTHGSDTYLDAADIKYPVADITGLLGTALSLAKKPKLFFIQACREGHILHPPPHDEDNVVGDEVYIPKVEPDCLVLYSTYEDHVAYRYSSGSWLMKALCEVIDAHHGSMNLKRMATLVNKKVAANIAGSQNGGYKQMSVVECDLKKFLMF